MKFVDVHSHLDLCKNIPEIVKKCDDKNILIVSCGVDVNTNRKMIELKEKFPQIEICLGIYPLDSLKMSDEEIEKEIDFIRKNKDKILGIGEVGLDKHSVKDAKSFDKQKAVLGEFVGLAKELNKPIFVHSRDAEKETIEFLQSFDYKKIVMHCFSGSMKLVERIVELGWMLSIPSSVKYNGHFAKIIEVSPTENLLCETDAPFLHPDKKPGMENNSLNVMESYKKIAEIKKMKTEEIKEKVWSNFLILK